MKRKKSSRSRTFPIKATARPKADPSPLVLAETRHCDDFIDDPTAPEPLRKYLAFAHAPAHGQHLPTPHPKLFADYDGTRVRVTMASRLGDVGITTDLDRDMGYERRVAVSQLSNFLEEP